VVPFTSASLGSIRFFGFCYTVIDELLLPLRLTKRALPSRLADASEKTGKALHRLERACLYCKGRFFLGGRARHRFHVLASFDEAICARPR
jgi:hypothetical protein